MFSVST